MRPPVVQEDWTSRNHRLMQVEVQYRHRIAIYFLICYNQTKKGQDMSSSGLFKALHSAKQCNRRFNRKNNRRLPNVVYLYRMRSESYQRPRIQIICITCYWKLLCKCQKRLYASRKLPTDALQEHRATFENPITYVERCRLFPRRLCINHTLVVLKGIKTTGTL